MFARKGVHSLSMGVGLRLEQSAIWLQTYNLTLSNKSAEHNCSKETTLCTKRRTPITFYKAAAIETKILLECSRTCLEIAYKCS